MSFSKLTPQTLENLTKRAVDLNYYGKRLKATKLAVVENVLTALDLQRTVEAIDLMTFFDENRPVKPEVVKQQKALESYDPTFNGSLTHRDDSIEVLPFGRYLISSAQNNTLAAPVFKRLIDEAQARDARLILMPIKYTTTLESRERKDPVYTPEVREFMIHDNVFIGSCDLVRLAVTAAILPTAKQPINTAKTLNNGESLTIVASPKAQQATLPRPKGSRHRWTYTSRTCTQRHYTDSRAGDEAENEHTFGAIYLDVREDGTVIHQEIIATESGSFFNPIFETPEILGIVAGDLHCEKTDPDSFDRLLGMIDHYNPKVVVTHDTLDFMSRNHHNIGSGRFLYQMGQRSVLEDLSDAIEALNKIAELTETVFVVRSNHDDALDQWLDSPHYRPDMDIINSKTYYYLKFCILEHLDDPTTDSLNCFELACRELSGKVPELADNVVFGKLDQEFKINGIECGQHGHIGSGGARGSLKTFKGYQMATITGHTHAPARDGVNIVVGVTGSLEMGYNKGGSAWDRSNAIIPMEYPPILVQPYAINEPQS
jgi:hypothetical protein